MRTANYSKPRRERSQAPRQEEAWPIGGPCLSTRYPIDSTLNMIVGRPNGNLAGLETPGSAAGLRALGRDLD